MVIFLMKVGRYYPDVSSQADPERKLNLKFIIIRTSFKTDVSH